MSRTGRRSIFSEEQDRIIVHTVQIGGFNNLQDTFERLSMMSIFAGHTPLNIQNRYYNRIRRNTPMFQICSLEYPEIKARVNYKNDPQRWTGATRRNNNRNLV